MSKASAIAEDSGAEAFDLLRVRGVGRFLQWRHARTALQLPLLAISVVMVAHGLLGPQLAPKNLATSLTWVYFRGALILLLLFAGNFFCMACPFMAVRNAVRRAVTPTRTWPRALRNKWPALALLIAFLFCYELFDLWSTPWWTAWLIVAYFGSAVAVDSLFKHATFCKFLCPIGQFNFLASTLSPLEFRVRSAGVCSSCATKDCIRGRRDPVSALPVLQRGCELALFQPAKVGNMDCTFCLDCVHACPHDNVGILSRAPGGELALDPLRSGIGYFSKRRDIAALAVVLAFAALLNAFGMVSPVYALEAWIGRALHVRSEAPVLALLFAAGLGALPFFALWTTTALSRPRLATRGRFAYGLLPLGCAVWLAHYGFHFFTGLFTGIPVLQEAVKNLGFALLGEPQWTFTGIPVRFIRPLEGGFLTVGLLGSLLLMYRFARLEEKGKLRVFMPWAALCLAIFAAAVWLTSQPMEMRATFLN